MSHRLIRALKPHCTQQDTPASMLDEWIPGQRYDSKVPTKCICGVEILERCEIIHKKTNEKLIVGNECISNFSDTFLGYCARCYINPIVSKTSHYCYDCGHNKIDRPSGRVILNQDYYEYPEALKKNPAYCKYLWEIRGHEGVHWKCDSNFLKYLDLCIERNTDELRDVVAWKPPPPVPAYERKHNYILRISKHKGKTYKQMITEEGSFCAWVRQTPSFSDTEFRKYCLDLHEAKVARVARVG